LTHSSCEAQIRSVLYGRCSCRNNFTNS